MHIVQVHTDNNDTNKRTSLNEEQTLVVLNNEDFTSSGDQFRGWKIDVLLIPKIFKYIYDSFPVWDIIAPCLSNNSSIKFY